MNSGEELADRLTGSTEGDQVYIKTQEGNEYAGTVHKQTGATAHIQYGENQSLEVRVIRPDDTYLVLDQDGKSIVSESIEKGPNKFGDEVTTESTRMSFDEIVTEFKVSDEPLRIG